MHERDERGRFLPTLPRYYDGYTSYLELHAERTLWRLDNPRLYESAEAEAEELYVSLVLQAAADFETVTGVSVYLLGRSGRHVCVEDTPENSKRYTTLRKLALELAEGVIKRFNTWDPETD